MNKKNKKKKLILLDSNALVHRAFHALPPLTTKEGTPSGAVYGVALTLMSVLEKENPDYIVAAFDLKGPTFRHKQFSDYKANRKKAPDELYAQIPLVKEMFRIFGIPVFEKSGFEADDVLGSIAKDKNLNGDLERMIVTGDMDVLQLVDDDIRVFMLRRGIKDTAIFDADAVQEKYHLTPRQIIDYKALRGDPSDNIPGVKGVGDKTAVNLLSEFKTLEGVYKNIEKTKGAVKKKLEDDKKNAFLSYDLATIRTDVDVDFKLSSCDVEDLDRKALADFFRKMGFRTLFKKVAEDGESFNEKEEKKDIEIIIAENDQDFEGMVALMKEKKQFAYSLLIEDKNLFEAKILGIGICVEDWKTFFLDKKYLLKLKDIFENNEVLKIGFDVKSDFELLWREFYGDFEGTSAKSNCYGVLYGEESKKYKSFVDVQLLAYALGEGNATKFEKLILEEFDAELEFGQKKKGQASLFATIDDSLQKLAAEKSNWILKMQKVFDRKLMRLVKEQNQGNNVLKNAKDLFENLEKPLKEVLAKMEFFGVKLEKEKLMKISKTIGVELSQLEEQIHIFAGENFNINSPSQLATILFEKMEISTAGIKKGKTGFSTDADQLRKIRGKHEIVPLVERYRELFKVKSTYVDALPALLQSDGRIHARFNQAVTATGRLSSSDPNLQNIPKKGELARLIRSAFAADEGKVLVSADYSQIDLRVAAHISKDEKMSKAFLEGRDIHRTTAAWVAGVSDDKVTDEMRRSAKSLNFGVLYGMGVYGFMRDSGLDREKAEVFLENYAKTFVELTEFIEKTKAFVREKGYVETEFGRRRYIAGADSFNSQVQAAAERMAINLPIQGLASDIMKLAMIAVEEKLLSKYNKESIQVKMILQIHDEMIFEVDEKNADVFMKELVNVMETVYKLRVPLVVGAKKGKTWAEV